MKQLFLLAATALLLLIACQLGNKSAVDSNVDSRDYSPIDALSHTAIDAREHIGLYKGILPGADCEGIETSLYLMANNAYLLTKVYKGVDDKKEYKNIGDFEWNEDGTTVTLSNIENAPNQFLIEQTQAIQLNMTGKRVEGDLAEMYVLVKQ